MQMPFDCGALNYPQQGIVLALFLAGLLGSLTHCVGMCSPFVISQVTNITSQEKVKEVGLQRIKGALLLPYHSGRITTYMLLGVIASLLSAQVMAFPIFKMVSIVLLVLAGIIFLGASIGHLGIIPFPSLSCGIPRWLTQLTKPLFASPIGLRGYILGLMLGFMPCGLVFAAVMAVTATGNPWVAALAMVGFGLGTIPSLLMVSLGSRFFLNSSKKWLQPFSTAIMICNSFLLFFIAAGWNI